MYVCDLMSRYDYEGSGVVTVSVYNYHCNQFYLLPCSPAMGIVFVINIK